MMRIFRPLTGAALAAAVTFSIFGAGPLAADAAGQQTAAKATFAPIPGGTYAIDPSHSVVGFAIRHFEISWVQGRFKDFVGTIQYDEKDVTNSSVDFTAKVASIDTGVTNRDNHLRTADFFEVEKFPELSFKSTRIERTGENRFTAHGTLTIKGVAKPVSIPFTLAGALTDPRGGVRIGADGSTTINRLDYGVGASAPLPTGGFAIGNDVTVELSIEAIKRDPAAAK